jgi:hypothetical protein
MANISINVPDAVMPRLLDAIAAGNDYDEAGGKTKAQFAQQQMKLWLRGQLEWYEGGQAERDARQAAVDAIRGEMPDD